MPADYSVVVVFLVIAVGFVVVSMWLSWAVRPYRPSKAKLSTYECGEPPYGQARIQFNFRYYIFALFFVVFEVETVFLYPWAIKFKEFVNEPEKVISFLKTMGYSLSSADRAFLGRNLGLLAFGEMVIFLGILTAGLYYAWKKDVLKWV